MRWLALLILSICPLAAMAADFPALHDVRGVAANDVLNIRAEPAGSAPIIGTLAPNASGVEVIEASANGRWGRVNAGERAGWTSMRYLTRTSPPIDSLPMPMTCFGTEPFWSVLLPGGGTITVETGMGADTRRAPIRAITRSANRTDRFGVVAQGLTGTFVLQACSDGMSDRAFGITADFLLMRDGSAQQISGCCSLGN